MVGIKRDIVVVAAKVWKLCRFCTIYKGNSLLAPDFCMLLFDQISPLIDMGKSKACPAFYSFQGHFTIAWSIITRPKKT
jgi:hypothetical protein